jgi:hypothetical protein
VMLEPETLVTAGLAVATMYDVAVPSGLHGDQSNQVPAPGCYGKSGDLARRLETGGRCGRATASACQNRSHVPNLRLRNGEERKEC